MYDAAASTRSLRNLLTKPAHVYPALLAAPGPYPSSRVMHICSLPVVAGAT